MKLKKLITYFNLSLIVLSLFSFSFLLSEINFVSSAEVGGANLDIDSLYPREPLQIGSQNTPSFSINPTTGGPASSLATKVATGEPSKNLFSSYLGLEAGGIPDTLVSSFQWAAIAYVAGRLIGGFLGFSKENTNAFATSLAAGAGVYKGLATYGFKSGTFGAEYLQPYAPAIGLGFAVIVFVAMYKETKTETVTFSCLPWQAPTGSDLCEVCNDDILPCSEYRCKSLGQNCDIVNKGTPDEQCVNVNRNDVSQPIITPDENKLTLGHAYRNVRTSPPGPGFEIINTESSDGCLKPFTPLQFGILTNEPSQCRIDFKSTLDYEKMATYFGGSNLFSYNHTEKFILPNTDAFENSSLVLENGKDLTFFIRCIDAAGNENTAEYAVNLCIDPSPDTTAPQIVATSIRNNGCIAEAQDIANVEFYTNEPSTCKWDFENKDYDQMNNDMSCSNALYQLNAQQLYTCRASLDGIAIDGTDYYIRCKDQPGKDDNDRNENRESFKFNLRGSNALSIRTVKPNETIFGGVSPAPIELYAETAFGCNEGQAVCYFSTTGEEEDFIRFFDTNNEDGISTQRQNLISGNHKYFLRCIDEGGNVASASIAFNVNIDTNPPVIARIYEQENFLKIVTLRNSICSYSLNSCDFTVDEGTQMPIAGTKTHITEWNKERTYYIKCRDEFQNEGPDCSAIVKPSTNFLKSI